MSEICVNIFGWWSVVTDVITNTFKPKCDFYRQHSKFKARQNSYHIQFDHTFVLFVSSSRTAVQVLHFGLCCFAYTLGICHIIIDIFLMMRFSGICPQGATKCRRKYISLEGGASHLLCIPRIWIFLWKCVSG